MSRLRRIEEGRVRHDDIGAAFDEARAAAAFTIENIGEMNMAALCKTIESEIVGRERREPRVDLDKAQNDLRPQNRNCKSRRADARTNIEHKP